MKPHICCYTVGNASFASNADSDSRLELGYAELFIEVQADPSHDFFIDPPPDITANGRECHDFIAHSSDSHITRRRSRAFGQHIPYATEVLARQYRLFVFSISMCGSRARFLRWDRAGCVVSTSFDIREEPELLCEFLWRFSQAPELGRGHDLTTEMASPEEEELFRTSITKYVRFQLDLDEGDALDRAVSEHYQSGHAAVFHVLEHGCAIDAEHIRKFIVSRPVVSPLYLTGRATRGFWAVDALTSHAPSTRIAQ